jgi:valyl-tRNA synthetase
MSEIPKAYEPGRVEPKWYDTWERSGFFTADPASPKPAYSIVIPPPNVTGVLHMGHVLNNTVQDILARKARMEGFEVLWLPGTDHAGIATQAVVEKSLRKQGLMKHRNDLGREKFLEHVWAWKEKHGDIIIQQLKRLGCSCDWTRLRFTMDPDYSRCVQKVFVALFRDGLIYRGLRMVNWDPAAQTALSDEEVEWIEEKSHLWHLKYPLLDTQGRPSSEPPVLVATTRPETMLGDEAVAVHPRDPRYQALIGRRVLLPLRNKPIPIIADEAVDPEFGTGCVKVTPAHDPADYEMAQRHRLPLTVVIGPDGRMTAEAGDGFAGLDRMEARKAVVAHLEKLGLLAKIEDYTHRVGYSQRSHVPIEPRLSEQWFLRYPETERALRAVEQGEIQFHPDRWVKTYSHWMTHLKDWCISRQLWWGHRIPVWTRTFPDAASLEAAAQELSTWGPAVALRRDNLTLLVATAEEPLQAQLNQQGWTQDPDVLDTWFSSWLWPFATMGWTGDPARDRQNPTLQRFYPTTDLVTGPDIIFFWVARMIMAGLRFMDAVPFRHVYFTGIIRDKLGRKMSKSLGNSPDPLDLIARYGADALRFGTMRSAPLGQDVLFDEKDVELGRNFCNKLWNACRFRQLQGPLTQAPLDPDALTVDDRWILLRLDAAIREIHAAFASYRFSEVTQTLYRFFWSEYCDWYVEASKAVLYGSSTARKEQTLAVLDFVLHHTLRLFHPFLPHITEELWHGLGFAQTHSPDRGGRTIMFAPWPQPLSEEFRTRYRLDDAVAAFVEARYALVTEGRNLRRLANLPANRKVRFILKPTRNLDEHDRVVLQLLLQAETLELDPHAQPQRGTATCRTALGDLFLPLEGLIDLAAETTRLQQELEKIETEITRIEQRLQDPQFTAKAPAHVLEEHRRRLAEWRDRADHTRAAMQLLQS